MHRRRLNKSLGILAKFPSEIQTETNTENYYCLRQMIVSDFLGQKCSWSESNENSDLREGMDYV